MSGLAPLRCSADAVSWLTSDVVDIKTPSENDCFVYLSSHIQKVTHPKPRALLERGIKRSAQQLHSLFLNLRQIATKRLDIPFVVKKVDCV